MMTENDALMEIVHLASAALVADLSDVKRQALADIYDAIASIVPVEGKRREAEEQRVSSASADEKSSENKRVVGIETPREPEAGALTPFQKFLTMAPGVQLVRFNGKKKILLVARRKGSSGIPNTVFQIVVDKENKCATVWRDQDCFFELDGMNVGYSNVEKMAVSALHCWFKNQRKNNARRRRAEKRRRLGILTPEQELARTVAEQKAAQ